MTAGYGRYYVGLMAGTSLDGVDAALVDFPDGGSPHVLAALTVPYADDLRTALKALGPDSTLRMVATLDGRVADAFAAAALRVLAAADVPVTAVGGIGSHGQTIWHTPEPPLATSIQIGDPNRIAERCGIDVVADFRRRDMAAGGQGAPLAPAFHRGLFQGPEDRVVLNLGGIANVTALPATGTVTGFDAGPANTLLDAWIGRHRGERFDEQGGWAATGTIDDSLLAALLADPFFATEPPRSTGPEYFSLAWLERHLRGIDVAPRDVQATLAELTARTGADAARRALPGARELVVCGGGAHNTDLMNRLASCLPGVAVTTAAAHGVSPDWVEAIGFAWLARETLAGRPGNLPSVTGASHPVVMGGIYRGAA